MLSFRRGVEGHYDEQRPHEAPIRGKGGDDLLFLIDACFVLFEASRTHARELCLSVDFAPGVRSAVPFIEPIVGGLGGGLERCS